MSQAAASQRNLIVLYFIAFGTLVFLLEGILVSQRYELGLGAGGDKVLYVAFFLAVQILCWWLFGLGIGESLRRWAPRRFERAAGLVAVWAAFTGAVVFGIDSWFFNLEYAALRILALNTGIALVCGAAVLGVDRFARRTFSARRLQQVVWVVPGLLLVVAIASLGLHATGPRAQLPAPDTVVPQATNRGPRLLLPKGTNVLLILVDTLRADHLSYSGYGRETSPSIDAWAARGVRFTKNISQATRTSPAMASLLTGVSAKSHGIVWCRTVLDESHETWGELLESAGYQTAAMVANVNMGKQFQFTQGIQEVHELFRDGGPEAADVVFPMAMEWLRDSPREPFFLWVHSMDPHAPYEVGEPYATLFQGDETYQQTESIRLPFTRWSRGGISRVARLGELNSLADYISRYDGEIRLTDHYVGQLLETLDRTGLRERTLVVFTADHGENLGEHDDYFAHGTNSFDPTARVPLVFIHPSLPEGLVIDRITRSMDVLPTVLDLLHMERPAAMEGESLVPLMSGEPVASRIAPIWSGSPDNVIVAARDENWKLVLTPRRHRGIDEWVEAKLALWRGEKVRNRGYHRDHDVALYDLANDPQETRNLAGQGRPEELALRAEINTWISSAGGRRPTAPVAIEDLSPETLEQLKTLGYIE